LHRRVRDHDLSLCGAEPPNMNQHMLRAEVAPRPRPPRSAAGVDWSGQAPASDAARDLRRPAMVRGRPRTRRLGRRRLRHPHHWKPR